MARAWTRPSVSGCIGRSAELAAREEQKRAERARFAGNRASQQWDAARAAVPDAGCPYLVKKGVDPEKGLRFLNDGTLYVPTVRYDVTEEQEQIRHTTGPRRLVGLQKIAPDGVSYSTRAWRKTARPAGSEKHRATAT